MGVVRNFSNKYRICDDRKKIRDDAVKAFTKHRTAYEKKQASAPSKLEEINRLHGQARLAFTHLETQNKNLMDLIDELMRDKYDTLNKIVADYMMKSFMFHKKAN